MKRILIVEDDLVTTQVYKNLLETEGYAVELAPDGETAVRALSTMRPDLILLDLLLPKVHGLQVLKHARAQAALKDVPIIVLSNAYLSTMVKAAWKEGANMCLTKADCTPDYLLAVVRTTLGSSSFLPRKGSFGDGAGAPATPPPLSQGIEEMPPSSYPTPPPPTFVTSFIIKSPTPGGARPAPSQTPHPIHDVPKSAATPAAQPRPATPPPVQATPSPPPVESTPIEPDVDSHSFFTTVSNDSVHSLQSRLRNRFLAGTPMVLEALRGPLPIFQQKSPDTEWMVPIFELYEAVHPLSGSAAVSGFVKLAHLASSLEALLKELMEDPSNINSSTLRTITDALDFLIQVVQQATEAAPIRDLPSLTLVVDDDVLSLQMVTAAMETANLRSVNVSDPLSALKLIENNRFDLIFADVNMPELDGFEFATKVRASVHHKHTPIVMVTSLNTFEVRTKSATIGANDMIAKPFLHSELALKALTYLCRNPTRRISS